MNETGALRRGVRWVALQAGGRLLALIGLAHTAFVLLGALLFGQHAVAGVPVIEGQVVGVTFAADGGVMI